jgi:hypothetical protein
MNPTIIDEYDDGYLYDDDEYDEGFEYDCGDPYCEICHGFS